ncbi:MAG: NAD-dependent epimerase/dehydratase family protein [Candidatus Coatesbacteria bacterium]|nr:NAD-dependent epimerase/dehydratase family protein [Candidatus Coatesbacteria bacterium]
MKALVTGAAGFIGSSLCEALIEKGFKVTGIDCFSPYYSTELKRNNISILQENPEFDLIEEELGNLDLRYIVEKMDYVFHLAAQPGVRKSIGKDFSNYAYHNIVVTQKLLDACIDIPVKSFVYSSSSSIYGNALKFPTDENTIPAPVSPYGITKLAGEHLAMVYHKAFKIPSVVLRFFTVYGKRQRPDMAFKIIIDKMKKGESIEIYGDGNQTRDFTYIDDVVSGILAASSGNASGEIFNIGGGSRYSLLGAIEIIRKVSGIDPKLVYKNGLEIDAKDTSADITKAFNILGYKPRTTLKDGLQKMWNDLNC